MKIFENIYLRNAFLIAFPIFIFAINTLGPEGSETAIESLSAHSPLYCLFRQWTGLLCPGCGMTRSLLAFYLGHWKLAFYFNPFGPLLGMYSLLFWMFNLVKIEISIKKETVNRLMPNALALLILWGVVRNIYFTA